MPKTSGEIWPKMSENLRLIMQRVPVERSQRQGWSKQTNRVGTHWVLAEAGHDYRPQLLLRTPLLLLLLLLLLCHRFSGKDRPSMEYVQTKLQPKTGPSENPNPTNDSSETGKLIVARYLPQYPCLPQFISPLRVGHILSLPFFLG